METVSFKAVAAFTICQLVYLLIVYGITWIPIAGFLFPLPIIALIPIRALILPKVPLPAQISTSSGDHVCYLPYTYVAKIEVRLLGSLGVMPTCCRLRCEHSHPPYPNRDLSCQHDVPP